MTASAALEHGWGPEKEWPNPHHLELPGTDEHIENFGDEYCNGGRDTVTMGQAFESSCNVPFAEIGMALKAERMAAQAQAYGFCRTEPTFSAACQDDTIPFVLPWEVGHFPDASYFVNNEAALARSAIGLDNDLTNPLHLALIASAIANQGTMYEPRLVTEVRDATTGQTISDVRTRRLQPSVDRRLRRAAARDDGERRRRAAPAPRRRSPAWSSRARRAPPPTARARRRTRGSPRSRRPVPAQTARIAVAVIVLDGGDLGNEATGGQVAAPIAKQVMEAYLG